MRSIKVSPEFVADMIDLGQRIPYSRKPCRVQIDWRDSDMQFRETVAIEDIAKTFDCDLFWAKILIAGEVAYLE